MANSSGPDFELLATRIAEYQESIKSGQGDLGFACIGLFHPRSEVNIGSVLRAAHCFNALMVAVEGTPFKRIGTDVFKSYRNFPVLQVGDLHTTIPFGAIAVGVELIDEAVPLPQYNHPLRAYYVFGGENATLGRKVLSWCRDRVFIPTTGSLNLAMCVNLVLYDRMCKQMKLEAGN